MLLRTRPSHRRPLVEIRRDHAPFDDRALGAESAFVVQDEQALLAGLDAPQVVHLHVPLDVGDNLVALGLAHGLLPHPDHGIASGEGPAPDREAEAAQHDRTGPTAVGKRDNLPADHLGIIDHQIDLGPGSANPQQGPCQDGQDGCRPRQNAAVMQSVFFHVDTKLGCPSSMAPGLHFLPKSPPAGIHAKRI